MLIIFANYVSRKAIDFNAAAQPDYLALPYHACNQSCDVLKLKLYLKKIIFSSLDGFP